VVDTALNTLSSSRIYVKRNKVDSAGIIICWCDSGLLLDRLDCSWVRVCSQVWHLPECRSVCVVGADELTTIATDSGDIFRRTVWPQSHCHNRLSIYYHPASVQQEETHRLTTDPPRPNGAGVMSTSSVSQM